MSRERFEELVGDALDEVPAQLLKVMSNVVILVEDTPPGGGRHLVDERPSGRVDVREMLSHGPAIDLRQRCE